MSRWDEFKKSIGAIASKTAEKTRELSDTASLKIKIASKESDRNSQYIILGKLTYAKLKNLSVASPEEITEHISETLERIDTLNEEISALKAEERARRTAKNADSATNRTESRKPECSEERGEEIMAQFNQERVRADEEYEKAKAAADNAKECAECSTASVEKTESTEEVAEETEVAFDADAKIEQNADGAEGADPNTSSAES